LTRQCVAVLPFAKNKAAERSMIARRLRWGKYRRTAMPVTGS
jgi:hypothetical protein